MKKRRSLTNLFLWGILIMGLIISPSCNSPACVGWEFDTNGESEGWQASQGVTLEAQEGYAVGNITQPHSFWVGPDDLSIDATYRTLEIRYRITSREVPDVAYFHWIKADDAEYGNNKRVKFDIQTDNAWHDERVDLSPSVNWNGVITGVRLYPAWFSNSGTLVEYDYIRLCK